jgi:hypothetical protein
MLEDTHPTLDVLCDYIEGHLPSGQAEELAGHLAGCRACADLALEARALFDAGKAATKGDDPDQQREWERLRAQAFPSDLRSLWPNLSARERDALCAQGLGWTYKKKQGWQTGWYDSPGSVVPRNLPEYSSSWHGAGMLIEALGADFLGLLMDSVNADAGFGLPWECSLRGSEGYIAATSDSGPSAIALAFCLARNVSPQKGGAPAQNTTP